MIFRGCRIHPIFLLCLLALISCLSVGLFYRSLSKKGITIDTSHGYIEKSAEKDCMFTVALWTKRICHKTFDNLAWFPKFPSFPDQRHCVKNLSSVVKNNVYPVIKRILVSFSSLEPGFYQFRAKSSHPVKIFFKDGGNQSPDGDLILTSNGSTNFFTIFSKSFFWEESSILEILTYSPTGDNFLSLHWLVPGSALFVPIPSRALAPVHHVIPSQEYIRYAPRQVLPPEKRVLVGFIPHSHVVKGFSVCSSRDVQLWRETRPRNISVYTATSPLDTLIHEVLKLIMASLQKAAPSKYPAFKINKLEVTHNATRTGASRVLADLNMTVDGLDYFERFDEYIYSYSRGNQIEFCRPLCYQWGRTISLNFVFLTDCSRNGTPWGIYFIQNIIEVIQRSLEVNFRVIVTACDEEQHRSYTLYLRNSDIVANAVVLQEGTNVKSRAMKAVLSLVENDSIVILCEPRVKMPAEVSEEIRKHTFKSLMAYSPIPFQLDCGYFPESAQVKGDLCPHCGGVLAMYKDDWERVISSTDENDEAVIDKTRLLGRIEKAGIEIVQVKLKDLYRI